MSRSRLLHRIRAALGEAPAELPTGQPEGPRWKDRVERFRRTLEAAGGTFIAGESEKQRLEGLERVLAESQAGEVWWEEADLFERHGFPYRLRQKETDLSRGIWASLHPAGRVGFPLLIQRRRCGRQELARQVLSVSSARWGVAETGTVVEGSAPGGRLVGALPPAHLVLLSRSRLLMNLKELFGRMDPVLEGSALVLVSGPSRTADIEKTLITGVHGPGRLFVMLTG